MKKIILIILLVFNFGVISDTFAETFLQDCQMQKIAAQNSGISQSKACRESEQFNENVGKVLAPVTFSIKSIFGTLLVFIAASGAVALLEASFSSILKEKDSDGDPKSPILGWVGLFFIVPLLIYIFYEFNYYAPYGFFRWVFTITFFSLVILSIIKRFTKKTHKSK
jgi:hypothetical protein